MSAVCLTGSCLKSRHSPVTFHRPSVFGDAEERRVSMATRLLHHYSPAAVVKLVFGQALRQPNSDSAHSLLTHTAAHAKPATLNSSYYEAFLFVSRF